MAIGGGVICCQVIRMVINMMVTLAAHFRSGFVLAAARDITLIGSGAVCVTSLHLPF